MATWITIYWICFGVGLVYVLLAGALGAITHGFAGEHGGDSGGLDTVDGGGHGGFDTHGEALESADLDHDSGAGTHHGGLAHADSASTGMPEYNPLSLLSLMGTLAGFGAGGLLAANGGATLVLSLGAAAGGGLVMALLLWLIIGKLLYSMHASSEAHVSDMVGLEAEVLTPVERDMSGEIAYVLDGTRYTAPARLVHDGRVSKSEKVRIRRVGENIVYVEEKRKLLA